MLGSDASAASLGVIPCAIAWLFRLVEEQKKATKTRFSVRVSAVEVFGHEESFKDLLQEFALDGRLFLFTIFYIRLFIPGAAV